MKLNTTSNKLSTDIEISEALVSQAEKKELHMFSWKGIQQKLEKDEKVKSQKVLSFDFKKVGPPRIKD